MQSKIRMKTPLVEMDGDEMTRVLWAMIKEKLIEPYVELRTEYYDLGLTNRDDTNDGVTVEAANAIKKYGVGVKCATITPNAQRVSEYNLKEMWKSPNGTIRSILDGTVFREPIMVDNIKPYVRTWEESIIIARHAYGDVYSAVEMQIDGPGTAELVFTSETGERKSRVIKGFNGKGIIQGMHNTEESISHFAHSCFRYALDRKRDLWFATKDTISKTYDHRFKDIFEEIYESEYRELFEAAGIEYFYTLIDDIVARIISGRGGMVWACKNYDGDVMSDLVARAFGSLSMMTSVLVSPEGCYEYEAAHGTVTRHYYKYLKGEKTSTNSMATIFAWSGALHKRGELDGNDALIAFAERLEEASRETIESGIMTGDMAILCDSPDVRVADAEELLDEIAKRLEIKMM
ncbi:MAG TPA: NADP-dependent isocitrate dehydrogenase [Clostridia bacterium]|nr:NADP-dependent isocitrate dehydrogenase [Clostridia bacterium]HPQ46459.1 NADP-dependent isocitrate dehydrogenase [Clostridia bacterium]